MFFISPFGGVWAVAPIQEKAILTAYGTRKMNRLFSLIMVAPCVVRMVSWRGIGGYK